MPVGTQRLNGLAMSWRHGLLAALPVAVLVAFFSFDAIPQPSEYHLFADGRGCLGIPNFGDVASNLAFLLSGALGLIYCLTRDPPGARLSWTVFFAGVTLVAVGSPYYHWNPNNETLVWDRLPMTIGFMAVYVALLAEYADRRLQRYALLPAALLGLASVVYWAVTDDLRLYLTVQAMSLGSMVVMLLLMESEFGRKGYLVAALASYGLAIACEQLDYEIFSATAGAVSGHTIKHLFAALAPFWVFLMLKRRTTELARPAPAVA